jgi:hypothetical protein
MRAAFEVTAMNRYLAAAAILLASAAAAPAQTIIPCLDTDPIADPSGACAAAPTTGLSDQGSTGTLDQGIDQNSTSAIPEPATPQGMGPLVVPNDPLGQGVSRNPFGSSGSSIGTPSSINGNGGISSPGVQ